MTTVLTSFLVKQLIRFKLFNIKSTFHSMCNASGSSITGWWTRAAMDTCMDCEELLVTWGLVYPVRTTTLLPSPVRLHIPPAVSPTLTSSPFCPSFTAIRVGVKCYLTVLVSCTFLMTNSTQRLPMCFLAICVSLKSVYSNPLPIFRLGSFC